MTVQVIARSKTTKQSESIRGKILDCFPSLARTTLTRPPNSPHAS